MENAVKTFFSSLLIVFVTIFVAPAFSANLPSGYTELEYIESTGSQYIDTGLPVKSNTLADFDYQYTNCDSANYVFGQVSGTATSIMGYRTTRIWWFKPTNLSNACDLNKHTVSFASDGKVYQDGQVLATMGSFSGTQSDTMKLFAELNDDNVINKGRVKIYNFTFKEGSTIVRNFVPAKNSSGVVGMYDTVGNRFYTNAGTGEFTAGPVVLDQCRNLFDGSIEYGSIDNTGVPIGASTDRVRPTRAITIPAGTYTVSCANGYQIYGVVNGVAWSGSAWATGSKTFTVSDPTNTFIFALRNVSNPTAELDLNTAFNIQLEQGSTATEYVPYCANPIKIATTAYNAARFSPVKTDLNSAVATIREIVTKTINQTAAIASLQADKQTRPEDACPAGKKCLLVETEENGVIVPHWFPIIEAPEDN